MLPQHRGPRGGRGVVRQAGRLARRREVVALQPALVLPRAADGRVRPRHGEHDGAPHQHRHDPESQQQQPLVKTLGADM